MTVRLTMLAAAAGEALREVRFDDDSPLDDRGVRAARKLAGSLPAARRSCCAPSLRCRQTAEALGVPARTVPALDTWALGRWRGRTLDEVAGREPDAVAAWLADPAAAPHGGESLADLRSRVGGWLDRLEGEGPGGERHGGDGRGGEGPGGEGAGRLLAVADPSVIRAAVVHALGLPAQSFWRLDVAPLAAVELTGRTGRWNLRFNPLSS